MAEKTKIDILIETAQSAKNVRELRKSLMELKSAQEDVDKSSPDFSKLVDQINETEGRVGDLNDAFKTFAGSGMERLTSSTYLLRDGFQNLDLDKVKVAFGGLSQLPKALAGEINKLTGFVNKLDFASLGQGMKTLSKTGVGELTKSIVQLGKAILTNPILLLAAVITGLVVLVVQFADKIKPLRIAMELVGKVVDAVIQSLKDFSDWLGLTDFAGEEKANNTLANAQKEQTAIEKRYDREIAVAQAAGKDTVKLEKEKEVAVRNSIQTQINAINKLKEINGSLTDEQVKQLDDLKVAYEDSLNKTAVIDAKAKKDQEDRDKKELEEKKKKYEEAAKARVEANRKADEEIENLKIATTKDEYAREKMTLEVGKQRRIEEINSSKADAKKKQEEIKLILQKFKMDEEALNEKYNQKQLQADIELADKRLELRKLQDKKANQGTFIEYAQLVDDLKAEDGEYMKSYNASLALRTHNEQKALDELNEFKKKNNLEGKKEIILVGEEQIREYDRLKTAYKQAEAEKAAFTTQYELDKQQVLKGFRDKEIDMKIASLEEQEAIQAGFDAKEKSTLDTKYAAISEQDKMLSDIRIKILEKQKAKELDNADLTETEKKNIGEKYAQEEYKIKEDLINQLVDKEKEAADAKREIFLSYVDTIKGGLMDINSIASTLNKQEAQDFNQTKQDELATNQYNHDVYVDQLEQQADKGQISQEKLTKAKIDADNAQKQSEYETKLAMYNYNKELKRKEFKRNKAMMLAGAVIDTASGIMKSLASAPLAIGVVPNPAGIASLAAVTAAGIANIAKIIATKEENAGEPPKPPIMSWSKSGGSGGGDGSGSSGSNFMAPQFFKLGQSQNYPGPQRVYVLESDITTVQKRVQKVDVRNTQSLGG